MKKKQDTISHERQNNGLNLFSNSIEGLTQRLLGKHGLIQTDILRHWSEIVGKELADHSLPQKLDFKKDKRDEGVLFLLVSSGGFALEIQQKTSLIIEKINTYFGYKAVSQIKIVQQEVSSLKKQINVADITQKKLVSQNEQTYIDTVTEGIKDEDLKKRLKSLALSILRQTKKES